MRLHSFAFALLQSLSAIGGLCSSFEEFQQFVQLPTASSKTFLNVTTILSSTEPPYHAFMRCLRPPSSFVSYPTIGQSLVLSNTSNMTLVKLPASPKGQGEGWHKPPHPMWFVLLNGRARVWTPGVGIGVKDADLETVGGQEVWIEAEGKRCNQMVLALDTQGRGHKTWYYGEEGSEVLALQLPLSEGWKDQIEDWQSVLEGPCTCV